MKDWGIFFGMRIIMGGFESIPCGVNHHIACVHNHSIQLIAWACAILKLLSQCREIRHIDIFVGEQLKNLLCALRNVA